jgi:hypothetical protein
MIRTYEFKRTLDLLVRKLIKSEKVNFLEIKSNKC